MFTSYFYDYSTESPRARPVVCKPTQKIFYLDNGMKILVVQNDVLTTSSVSLDVRVGSLNDPIDTQGLAHLVEHVLFSSESNSFRKLLFNHSYSNSGAITSKFDTYYFFGISSVNFDEGLKEFARIFQKHSISQDLVNSEIKAVDSEYIQRRENQYEKGHFIFLDKVFPDHPMHQFYVGNSISLQGVKVEQVQDFIDKYYTADKMTLVISTNKSIESVEKQVTELFKDIPIGNLPENKISVYPFPQDAFSTISFYHSGQSSKFLRLYWFLPDDYDRTKNSCQYLLTQLKSDLLGSLKDQLMKKGLIHQTDSGYIRIENKTFININFILTSLGEMEYESVMEITFAFLAFLRKQPVNLQLLKDDQEIERIDSLNNPDYFNLEKVKRLATDLFYLPDEISIENCYGISSPEEIENILDFLTPSNVIVIMSTEKEFDNAFKSTVNFTNIDYWTEELNVNEINTDLEFSLVQSNLVIPTQFEIKNSNVPLDLDELPRELIDGKLWFKEHYNKVLRPEGKINVLLARPNFFTNSLYNYSLTLLLITYFQINYQHEFYYYERIGYNCSIKVVDSGIEFKFSGYNDKLFEYSQLTLNLFLEFIQSKEYEEIFKNDLEKYEQEFSRNSPMMCLIDLIYEEIGVTPYPTNSVNESTVRNLPNMIEFRKYFLSNSYNLRVQVLGNFHEQEARNIYSGIELIFKDLLTESIHTDFSFISSLLKPKERQYAWCDTNTTSNFVGLSFQCPSDGSNKRNNLFVVLFAQLFQLDFHNTFYEKQRLAFSLGLYCNNIGESNYLFFLLQSECCECNDIEKRLLKFINFSYKRIVKNQLEGEKEFISTKKNLLNNLKDGSLKFQEEYFRYWKSISDPKYLTLSNRESIEILESIDFEDFKSFIKDYLLPNGNERRFISIWIKGKDSKCIPRPERKYKSRINI